jgi:hypothetical protein
MDRAKARIRHKYFRWDSTKLARAQKLLDADTETETIERAHDLVLSEERRNHLAWQGNECFLGSGSEIGEVHGGLGTAISSLFQKVGLETDNPELRGHKIRPATFVRRK